MTRRTDAAPPDPAVAPGRDAPPRDPQAADARTTPGTATLPDLAGLSIAGLTRHRVLLLTVFLAGAWLVFAFVRQVGDVTAASGRAESLAHANQQLHEDITTLEAELRLIQRQEYIVQEARAYRLGAAREVPFSLQAPLPSLAPDAPGSAALRVGAESARHSPLEAWLTLLFGPVDGG